MKQDHNELKPVSGLKEGDICMTKAGDTLNPAYELLTNELVILIEVCKSLMTGNYWVAMFKDGATHAIHERQLEKVVNQ